MRKILMAKLKTMLEEESSSSESVSIISGSSSFTLQKKEKYTSLIKVEIKTKQKYLQQTQSNL